jgi:N-acetylglucosaminyldiphosphoundecaprenol N-acetyl-beta-D-mannosaminyltransferase
MSTIEILGVPIEHTAYDAATSTVLGWASAGESRYVCLANTHMLVEAHDDPSFRSVLLASDLNCADGMPVAWMQRLLGAPAVSRVRGPDLMLHVAAAAACAGIPIGLYGGSESVLATLVERFACDGKVAYAHSPPFRSLNADEDETIVRDITTSGAKILFVGLGCPKQERWMAAHRGRVPAVMLGVGAAFDFHAGVVAQAPQWIQRSGLEWAHRLASDPRRLWRRYARTNPKFAVLAARQLLFR